MTVSRNRRPNALTSILIPTDFSSGAKRAVERATHLPLGAKSQIHLVHVLPSGAPQTELETQAREHLARAASLIHKKARAAGGRPPVVVEKVLIGEPYVEIIRYAREADAELIVLGCKGAGISIGKVLGTTAARVMHMSDTPVLIVRTRPRGPYRRPLMALPLDPSARALATLTIRIAESGLRVLPAVRAYNVPFAGFISAGTDAEPSLHHRQCREEAEAALAEQVQSLARHGIRVNPVLRHGDARPAIIAEAARKRADLIALGTHARSGIAHALVGSVAEWIAANAASDVLIARPVRFTFEAP